MQINSNRSHSEEIAKDPWAATGEIIPETFPTKGAFLKTVGLGIAITVIQFGLFAILIIKPWH